MARKVSVSEVRKHTTNDDCWIVVDNHVYDMTDFAPTHPGGAQIIYSYAGQDASDQYNAVHAPSLISKTLSPERQLGQLDKTSISADWKTSNATASSTATAGKQPPLSSILNLHDFEAAAKASFSAQSWAYIDSASNDCITRDANIDVLRRIWFRPLVMRDVARVRTLTSLFGSAMAMPCVSTAASYPLDEVLAATPEGRRAWFQLYVDKDRRKTEALLRAVTRSGKVGAVFVTVDLPVISKREADERAQEGGRAGLARQTATFIDPRLSWEDVPWIRRHTDLPIVIKGVQRWEDAARAMRCGCDGIAVSNHGGRAADGAQPAVVTLLELHRYAPEVFARMAVLVDGGFRRGADVVKAVCLGAAAVGVGRPFLYALGYGEEGVVHAANVLREEIEVAMRLCGMTDLMADASPRYLNTKLVDGYVVDGRDSYLGEPRRITAKI
ncbi:cytochrome b2 [Cordyceps fumosorosea ARSEF 2679]|uniref:Cytochrome b2 n=1 Tax=Cordyceps fumosorosea (strain ARSEF 2679) TaxID=1081104 RepID=A0A167M395_CORFA|nr:cytochrome b2 [Cordyceps fumosorosea ARSEF 2679]OAA53863.1 cytochrome b2 [Cordyceps fumosorosea ARSEF 2679]